MSQLDSETKRLIAAIDRDKVQQARQSPADVKVLDGPRLFDMNCIMARAGIRSQYPSYSEEQVELELARRLAIARRFAEGQIYRRVEAGDE
jgi:hypothetical protein